MKMENLDNNNYLEKKEQEFWSVIQWAEEGFEAWLNDSKKIKNLDAIAVTIYRKQRDRDVEELPNKIIIAANFKEGILCSEVDEIYKEGTTIPEKPGKRELTTISIPWEEIVSVTKKH